MSDCSTYVDFAKYTSTKRALNKNLPNLNICKIETRTFLCKYIICFEIAAFHLFATMM